jgi:hypothetical protein
VKLKFAYFSLPPSVIAALVIIFVAGLESCTTLKPTTDLTGTWKDPEAKSYKDFFVAVLTKNLPVRSTIEGDIARKLKQEKVKASKSLDVIEHAEKVETVEEKKAAVEKIKGLGYDAIITVTLIKHTEENRYVPGTTSYAPTSVGIGTGYYNPVTKTDQGSGSYGAFGAYYMDASSAYNTDGYYVVDKVYFLESRLYDANTSKLVWSAQSETFYPDDIEKASSDFSYVMVEALKKGNLIYKKQ